MEIIDDLEYGKGGNRALQGTLYHPSNVEREHFPVIVWIHGGGWLVGDRYMDAEVCRTAAQAGFSCFSISYRLSSEAIFPAAIHDCKCAVRYLRANAEGLKILPEKIGVWGASAGGHLAVLLGTSTNVPELEGEGGWAEQSSAVQAVCDWFGPTDFLQMSAFPSDMDHDAEDSPESLFIGGSIQENAAKVQRANPITYISESCPPFYIAHGKKDRLVPFNQSQILYDTLLAKGINATFDVLDEAGHGGAGFEADSPLVERCIEFFKQRLT